MVIFSGVDSAFSQEFYSISKLWLNTQLSRLVVQLLRWTRLDEDPSAAAAVLGSHLKLGSQLCSLTSVKVVSKAVCLTCDYRSQRFQTLIVQCATDYTLLQD